MDQQNPDNPRMTVMGNRPVKVLQKPAPDILIACRTASGEDCYVPASAMIEMLVIEISKRVRYGTGPNESMR